MQTESAEKAAGQEANPYRARYESINKNVLAGIDKSLFDAIPREVFIRLMLDSWADQNPLVKMALQMSLKLDKPEMTETFVSMAVQEMNSIAAKMWDSANEWGTTDKPLPDKFRHLLVDGDSDPVPSV